MAVTLSPLAGAGWQFFDNNGVPLAGGLLYSYYAGTSTFAPTYTSYLGNVQNANPIVLDSSGRVTSEIWLTYAVGYKFVLKTAAGVQIWSYDNIPTNTPVPFPSDAANISYEEGYTVTAGNFVVGKTYLITSVGTTDFTAIGASANQTGIYFTATGVGSGTGTAELSRSVQSKLQESVSVLDFGADPTGTNDCTVAIQAATNSGKPVYFPAGTYKIVTGGISYTGTVVWYGEGADSIIECDSVVLTVNSGNNSSIDNLYMQNITAPWIIYRNPSNWSSVPSVVQSNGPGYQPTVNDGDVWSSLTTAQQNQNIGPELLFQGNATNIQVSRIFGRFVSILVEDAQNSVVRDCNFQAGKNFAGGIVFWNINNQQGEYNQAINNNIQYASFSGITFARNYDGLIQGNICTRVGESGIKTYQGTLTNSSSVVVDARCYRMQIVDNNTMWAYYDGFDFSSDYPHTGTIDSRHLIMGNITFGNRQTGFYADGMNTQFIGNQARSTGVSGFGLFYNESLITDNLAWGCNTSGAISGEHQMYNNGAGCTISNNYLNPAGTTGGYALYATGTNLVANNQAYGGQIFLGNQNAVTAQAIGNVDNVYQIQGSFTPTIVVGSTVQTSYNLREGLYTRVGQRIFFDITIQLTGSVSGTGAVSIGLGDLPDATARGTGIYGAAGSVLAQNCSYTGVLGWFINDGTSSLALVIDTNGTQTQITDANLTGASKFYVSGSYLANQ